MSSDEPRERPRLNLKPRDEAAAAKAAQERTSASKSNPFGAAKPREAILATRTGQKEEDILKAELEKERLKLRFTPEQQEQRKVAEAEIEELEEGIKLEEDEGKRADLATELESKKSDLDSLLIGFEKLAIERAKSGEGVRPSERRRLAEEREREQGGFPTGGGYPGAAPAPRGNYGSGEYSYGPPAAGGRGGRSNGYASSGSSFGGRGGSSFGGNYDYGSNGGPPARGGGFGSYSEGGIGSGGGSGGGGYRGGFEAPAGGGSRSGYNEPLAVGFDQGGRGGGRGGRPPAGGYDIFADGGSSYGTPPEAEGGFSRTVSRQDRF